MLIIKSLDDDLEYFRDDDKEAEKVRNHFPIMAGGKYLVYVEGNLTDTRGVLSIKADVVDGSTVVIEISNGVVNNISIFFK
ncbi:hypothetical protein [Grimontia marina]|uniref:hypothetical protein n=1 Tax=Grimontia marina TaxID=646534 RepID=UPI0012FC7095|nr:hypothetical protein [Grimontia marina]